MRRHWGWIAGCTVVAASAGAIYTTLVPPTWEATGVAQIAAVGQTTAPGQASVELAGKGVERMRVRGFQDDVLASLQIPVDDENPTGRLYRGSLKVRQLQNTDFLEIKVRAWSSDEAKRWVDATVTQLAAVHQRLAAPSIDRLKKQLGDVDASLQKARSARDALRDSTTLKDKIGPGERFAEGVYNANLLLKTDEEIRTLEMQRAVLIEALSPSRTSPTSLVNAAHVKERPVSPKTGLIVALAAALGFLAGLFVAYFLEGREEARSAVSGEG
jgi:uncharacterized protein involved in exopolysaccharide biosynthesis